MKVKQLYQSSTAVQCFFLKIFSSIVKSFEPEIKSKIKVLCVCKSASQVALASKLINFRETKIVFSILVEKCIRKWLLDKEENNW